MIKTTLDWSNFDWRYFQTMCIEIAKGIYPDCSFTEHLKHGQKQDGIDLLGYSMSDGSQYTIQCKREIKITEAGIKDIINEFRSGSFYQKSSHFTIATSASLQNNKLLGILNFYKKELKEENDIILDWWDHTSIEAKLRSEWTVVAYYFGKEQADNFCLPQLNYGYIQKLKAVDNYIPRQIVPFEQTGVDKMPAWNFNKKQLFDLKGIILKDRLKAHHICILADAYQGKSVYLRQAAYQLKEAGSRIHPILIDIKIYNVQPVESLLESVYGAWKKIPFRELIIFIDGLDEVPTEKFTEMTKHINAFSIKYEVSVIFSCRKLFYNKYDIGSILGKFEVFELSPMQQSDIDNYLKIKLGSLCGAFRTEAQATGINEFLYHPFYLVHIAGEYILPPHKLPGSKIKIIDDLTERSFSNSLTRQVRGSDFVKDNSLRFKIALEKLAFALQFSGVNSFTNIEMEQLFGRDEILMLEHNSLVVHSSQGWSFINAWFQEHIAARVLSTMSFDGLVEICTVGSSIKKIKTKWIQTLSSLLSILDFNGKLFQQILKLIEEDNIELLFQTESSKYQNELKLSFLKKLVEKCVSLNIRTLVVYEDIIGAFVNSSAKCKDYLLERLCDNAVTERIKVVLCKILRFTGLSTIQKERFLNISLAELQNAEDAYYAGCLIRVLTAHKIGNQELIDKLISIRNFSEVHEYREKIYDLILNLGLVDDYYEYGMKGLSYLIEHNKNIHHAGAENSLEDFLLSTQKSRHLCLFLKHLFEDGWAEYFERHGTYGRNFLEEFFSKLAEFYKEDPFVIFTVVDHIKDLGKKYLRNEFKQVDMFLEKTGTHPLIVRMLINDILNKNDWELGALITPKSYDYILFEFEEGDFEIRKLRNCFTGLRYTHKNEIADNFYKLCMDLTEGSLESKEPSAHSLYEEAERIKHKNDLIVIQSVGAFREGIEGYFKAYGSNSIPEEDLYVDLEGKWGEIRALADSHFIYNYLTKWHRNFSKISLKQVLKELNKPGNFENFRAEEILNYHFKSDEADMVLFPLLENYYKENLVTADFKDCIKRKDDRIIWSRKEFRLSEILKKFKFPTPEVSLIEMIWLDMGGTRGFESAKTNKTQTISQIVLEMLSLEGKIKLRLKVVESLTEGISFELVLGTHLALCRHLKITEAKDLILESIKKMADEYTTKIDAVDIYLELGGELGEILELFKEEKNYNSYFFGFLSQKLYKMYPFEIAHIGLKMLHSVNTESEKKVQMAKILAEIGVFEAFAYLVKLVKENKKSPHYIQSGNPISKINTLKALNEMRDIMYLVICDNKADQRHFHDSAKSIILEWLYTLAAKSEDDLKLVVLFIEEARDLLIKEYANADDFNWYINRILEEFRNSEETVKPISAIKAAIAFIQ